MANSRPAGESRLALLGPQATNWTRESLSDLQGRITADDRNKGLLGFLKQAVTELPSLWPLIDQSLGSRLDFLPGAVDFAPETLAQLAEFANGTGTLDPQRLTNTALAPLTVVAQIIDFVQTTASPGSEEGLAGLASVQGFCIGFLSAAALASATTWAEFEHNAANAIRLAACVGIIVDAYEAWRPADDRVAALSVRWKTEADRTFLETCLDQVPGAYVSCITDANSQTITLRERSLDEFAVRLREAGVASSSVGLRGRYHHALNDEAARALVQVCADRSDILGLPDAKHLRLPLRSTEDGRLITTGTLHDVALQLILCKPANWFQTVKRAMAHHVDPAAPVVPVTLGGENCVPRSLRRIKTGGDHDDEHNTAAADTRGRDDLEIAVVGMACRFPRAEDLASFWELLVRGETAIGTMPPSRFDPGQVAREPKLATYWGNFLDHPDLFDHRFFSISGREAKSMDPQQRLALQVAYEALESSGYLGASGKAEDVGCYLGVGAVEYEANVSSEKANSFAALGTLRAFISGRISHFFGWTGPSITFDTACSSSAVAIHTACKALAAGECSMALAGGVNVITSPMLHQNLAAASFLNPNGASKAFDAEAGGYCRGEGAGIVVLKTLARAIADGDTVLGVIAASAVNQGSNCSSITVPDSGSQSSLYQRVLRDARIAPQEVGYVEAHGTGTPVGDPIEYESVRHALTGGSRDEAVLLGSVKDNIGHTEAASGAAGLIKVLLMMQNATVPKQAGFTSLSPRINPCPEITVPIQTTRWTAKGRRVALVNNYGAAGSNAALLVRSHTNVWADSLSSQQQPAVNSSSTVYPVLLAAKTANALQEYMAALRTRLPKMAAGFESIAYRLARGCNPSFDHRAAFVAGDVNGAVAALEQAVAAANSSGSSSSIVSSATRLPVVLCFGGQTGHTVRVSKELYDSCDLLRRHLDACDAICSKLGLPTIFPAIFHDEPVKDLVALHCMLLALQISAARCWLDSGLVVDTVIGHSFGQLSAMCIAGSTTLEDTFRLVAGRARLMRDGWGPERGAMLSVECSEDEVADVVKTVGATTDGHRVDVACFNGPRSFVLAGDAVSIAHAREECSRRAFKTSALQNSHAYHSHLADPIVPGLRGVASSIAIQPPPRLRVETCSAGGSWTPGDFTVENVAQHTRLPVYFGDAVERIAARLPSAVWLEAGSATPIVAMARRVLSGRAGRTDEFVPLELGSGNAASTLAKAACQLWKAGSDARPWLFHAASHGRHQPVVDVPPYQFEKTSHWIMLRPAPAATSPQPLPPLSKETALVSAITSRRGQPGEMFFSVDTTHAVFELAARGHAVMGLPLCPASMYLELAARAVEASGKRASTTPSGAMPHFEDLVMSAPLGLGTANSVFLRLQLTSVPDKWDFAVFSQPAMSGAAVDAKVGVGQETQHARGRIGWAPLQDAAASEKHLRLLQRFAAQGMKRLASAATTGISGTMVYKLFSDVVTYAEYFRGVQSVSASAHHAVGQVSASALAAGQKRWFAADGLMTGITEAVVVDNFLQVAGIHVNCLSPREDDQVFMCTAVEEVMFAARFAADRGGHSRAWHVYTRYEPSAHAGELRNDIFVCDAVSGDLVLVVLGAVFKSVPFRSVARSLARINRTAVVTVPLATSTADSDNGGKVQDSGYQSDSHSPGGDRPTTDEQQHTEPISPSEQALHRAGASVSTTSNVIGLVCGVLSSILEIPVDEITADASLDDLGVDSLLVPEVASEIERQFGVSLTQDELLRCADVRAVAMLVQPASPEKLEVRQDSASHGVESEPKPPVKSVPAERVTNGTDDALANGSHPLSSDDCNLALISHESFRDTKPSYDGHAVTTGYAGFYGDAFQLQSELVVRYVVEAFKSLGCDLHAMRTGDQVPVIPFQAQHKKLIPQLYKILQDAGLVTRADDGVFRRSAAPIPATPSAQLHEEMLSRFPKHASETKLLNATGPRLAECLSGTADPIALIFQNAKARALLEDVYTNAPMFKTGTLALAEYLGSVLARLGGRRPLRILELGAGTGGTSKHMIETLATAGGGGGFTYTFTDLSPSLVAAAKRKFAKWPMVQYAVVNVEEDPPAHLLNAFDIVLSTNCIHATHDLVKSTTNIRKMLRPDGILCLVELTRNLYWFDLVFGLLEGWWLFDDGREHALAHERRWDTSLRAAGFEWVDWTSSAARESDTLRVITASPFNVDDDVGAGRRDSVPAAGSGQEVSVSRNNQGLATKETVTFKTVDNLQLQADIFYPDAAVEAGRRLPIALMIHGGGHIMLSRKDIRPEQTALLLRSGFLPISVDYRLCPETTLLAGPMADVADALSWARTVLPRTQLARPDVIVDPERVVAVGWSTGGHLAMTLGWTTPQPPSAILALYCPTDYEDGFWTKPNVPDGVDAASFAGDDDDEEEAGIWEAVFDVPVTAYNVAAGKRAVGGWLARDDARSRLAQLMNVRGLTLPVLLHGLDKKTETKGEFKLAMPSPDLVARASPLAQIRAGRYGSPTFIVHPRQDDLIPWQQAERTWLALREAGVDAELRVVEDVPHLFDLSPRHPGYRAAMAAVEEGYAFLCRHAGLEWRE